MCRFEITGDWSDISDAIVLQRRVVELAPEDHPRIPVWLNTLGLSLMRRFERIGDMDDISEAISLQRRAIELTPKGHARMPFLLNHLKLSFLRRFELTGDVSDISEAISLQQKAAQITADIPTFHSNWISLLIHLYVLVCSLCRGQDKSQVHTSHDHNAFHFSSNLQARCISYMCSALSLRGLFTIFRSISSPKFETTFRHDSLSLLLSPQERPALNSSTSKYWNEPAFLVLRPRSRCWTGKTNVIWLNEVWPILQSIRANTSDIQPCFRPRVRGSFSLSPGFGVYSSFKL